MSTYATVEEYAKHVQQVTFPLLGAMCSRMGPSHPATVAIADLLSEAAGITNQAEMVEELDGTFDLGQLVKMVDTSRATDSESPFEDE